MHPILINYQKLFIFLKLSGFESSRILYDALLSFFMPPTSIKNFYKLFLNNSLNIAIIEIVIKINIDLYFNSAHFQNLIRKFFATFMQKLSRDLQNVFNP